MTMASGKWKGAYAPDAKGGAVIFCDTKYTKILSSVEAGMGVEGQIMCIK